MSLTSVKMSEDVWLTCLTHALSTETEEIMGLLLGDVQCSKNGTVTALIWGASPQTRSDRRKDRVETNPEQLAAASAQAERMTVATGRTTRVIGWYHSHPHITVLPSHVDVRTQAMYQLLDTGFIGLIFSCFSEDAQKVGRIQVIAFQSLDGKQSRTPKPIPLSPVNKSSFIDLESSLSSSENASTRGEILEQDTCDSKSAVAIKGSGRTLDLGGFFSSADANYLGKDQTGSNLVADNTQNAAIDVDPMDMTESMQEAMHRSNLDMRYAGFMSLIHCLKFCLLSGKINFKATGINVSVRLTFSSHCLKIHANLIKISFSLKFFFCTFGESPRTLPVGSWYNKKLSKATIWKK